MRRWRLWLSPVLAIGLLSFLAGCNWNSNDETQRERDEKTREEAEKATERLKPDIQEAGRQLGQAAHRAAEEAHAAAKGVEEGWKQGSCASLDLNSASQGELEQLPGITSRDARKIIAGRPYRDKGDIVSRGVLPESKYTKIEDQVSAR